MSKVEIDLAFPSNAKSISTLPSVKDKEKNSPVVPLLSTSVNRVVTKPFVDNLTSRVRAKIVIDLPFPLIDRERLGPRTCFDAGGG
eukprot:CAMPEP_0178904792 /NCGR_PEP_ID=MMETSP0786-20121207/5893_1 /TAXON_ID=186022 /ORGANISM="Thalassionema frauenfeldii, Strain CCMP 1798" /LENGTH=85 /DNA_ID=CAMNT_0020576281 /DNA_START=133 /DNA_END=390 /DNA_ORIENTATION=+